eukprot:11192040-Lingulodinium_polyedra.AAC.1
MRSLAPAPASVGGEHLNSEVARVQGCPFCQRPPPPELGRRGARQGCCDAEVGGRPAFVHIEFAGR